MFTKNKIEKEIHSTITKLIVLTIEDALIDKWLNENNFKDQIDEIYKGIFTEQFNILDKEFNITNTLNLKDNDTKKNELLKNLRKLKLKCFEKKQKTKKNMNDNKNINDWNYNPKKININKIK